jgi:uncharacterized membrane protein YdjX (TVP38/TMEM64 family)
MLVRPLAALALVLLAVIAATVALPHSPAELRDLVAEAGVAAPAAALVAWVLLTPALFPGTVLAAAGGLAFGALGGAALAMGGAVLGGLVAFTLARTTASGLAQRLVRRSSALARVNEQLERRGFAAVLAARLMPGVPATALHYAAGASPVRYGAFTAAMAIGALVRTAPYALLGQGLASGSAGAVALAVVPVAIGGAGGLALLRHLRRAPGPAPRDHGPRSAPSTVSGSSSPS